MGAIIKYTSPETGQEQEFEILVKPTKYGILGTHFVDAQGNIRECPGSAESHYLPTHLRLIRKRHTHGRVVFEETGEVRVPWVGEWTLFDGKPIAVVAPITASRTILRPVAIEEQL